MKNKMTIEELAQAANEELEKKNLMVSDSRQSNTITVRRIRDYLSKNLLSKPTKEGRSNIFNEIHLQELVSLREAQHAGLSDKYLKTATTYYSEESSSGENFSAEQASALDLISSMQSRTENPDDIFGPGLIGNTQSIDYDSLKDSTQKMVRSVVGSNTLQSNSLQPVSWEEYNLSENEDIQLKIKSNADISDIETILNKTKQILNNKTRG